jgi:hypothetical protein
MKSSQVARRQEVVVNEVITGSKKTGGQCEHEVVVSEATT